jgi:hypothetical protein
MSEGARRPSEACWRHGCHRYATAPVVHSRPSRSHSAAAGKWAISVSERMVDRIFAMAPWVVVSSYAACSSLQMRTRRSLPERLPREAQPEALDQIWDARGVHLKPVALT